MFASKVTRDVALPSDPSITVTIRKLSWLQREDAERKMQQASRKEFVAVGGAEFAKGLKELLANDAPKTADASATPSTALENLQAVAALDPLNTHDKLTVLVCGIASWSSPEPCDKAHIEDLADDDADFLAREILAMTLRKRTEEEGKNVGGGSTGSSTENRA